MTIFHFHLPSVAMEIKGLVSTRAVSPESRNQQGVHSQPQKLQNSLGLLFLFVWQMQTSEWFLRLLWQLAIHH